MDEYNKQYLGRRTKRDKEIEMSLKRIQRTCEEIETTQLKNLYNSLCVLSSESSIKTRQVADAIRKVIEARIQEGQ